MIIEFEKIFQNSNRYVDQMSNEILFHGYGKKFILFCSTICEGYLEKL